MARFVRLMVAAIPVAAAIGCSSLVSRALPSPVTTAEVVRWWTIVIAVSTSTLLLTDRFARRLLPLSVLLRMSLPFPEAKPSRIRVAIRSGSPKQLERWAASVSQRGCENPKAIAAHELLGLVTALSVHDRRSRGHSERVRVYTDLIAEQLDLSKDDADKLRWASLLHDIGKIHVPADILNKPGKPDPEEWEIIKRHPLQGDLLIEPVRTWLGSWGRAVVEHHEKWDGTGYPRGIAGTQISLAGRVVAVTDSYEVMTATRSYKKPMSVKAARAELTRCAGTHFDPAIVRAFLSVPIGRVSWAAGPVVWLAQLPFLGQIPSWGASAAFATSVVAATPAIAAVTPLPFQAPALAPVVSIEQPTAPAVDTASPSVRHDPAFVAGPVVETSAAEPSDVPVAGEPATANTSSGAASASDTMDAPPQSNRDGSKGAAAASDPSPTTLPSVSSNPGTVATTSTTTTTTAPPDPTTTTTATTVPTGNNGNGNGGSGNGQGSGGSGNGNGNSGKGGSNGGGPH